MKPLPLKIRASAAGKIMGKPKSGTGLSETAKSYLIELWIEKQLGRYQDFSNKYTEKGIAVEEASITLYSEVKGVFYRKNEKYYATDEIHGTPDIVKPDRVIDTKSSWSIFTYLKSKLTIEYEWQLRIYMALTGLKEATLAYCLVDTPDYLIEREARSIVYKAEPGTCTIDEVYADLKKQMTYSDIPAELRVREFHLTHSDEKMEEFYAKKKLADEFYNSIRLNNLAVGGEIIA